MEFLSRAAGLRSLISLSANREPVQGINRPEVPVPLNHFRNKELLRPLKTGGNTIRLPAFCKIPRKYRQFPSKTNHEIQGQSYYPHNRRISDLCSGAGNQPKCGTADSLPAPEEPSAIGRSTRLALQFSSL
jgi:hypothetical protein